MRFIALVPYYIRWHYGQALKNIGRITKNFVWFFWHFFSIGLLFSTLFAPWQKIHEAKPRGFDLGEVFSVWTINIIMRITGAFIRLCMIILGLAIIVITFALSLVLYAVWIMLPFIMVFVLFLGIVSFINHP